MLITGCHESESPVLYIDQDCAGSAVVVADKQYHKLNHPMRSLTLSSSTKLRFYTEANGLIWQTEVDPSSWDTSVFEDTDGVMPFWDHESRQIRAPLSKATGFQLIDGPIVAEKTEKIVERPNVETPTPIQEPAKLIDTLPDYGETLDSIQERSAHRDTVFWMYWAILIVSAIVLLGLLFFLHAATRKNRHHDN